MKYYIKSKGKIFGPAEDRKIQCYVSNGFFSVDSLVSTDLKNWLPLQECISISAKTMSKPSISLADNTSFDSAPQTLRLSESNVVTKRSKKNGNMKPIIIGLCSLLVVAAVGASGYLLFKSDIIKDITKKSPEGFQQVCQKHQSAVGVVTVTLEDSNGKLLNYNGIDLSQESIGTAFAIGKNQFATNCHVAYGIQNPKKEIAEVIIRDILINEAKKRGAKNKQDFDDFLQNNTKFISEVENFVINNVRVRNVEIRLAHSGGRSLEVSGVQIHPRYRTSGFSSEQEYFKNGEFDVAILTTTEDVNNYFPVASKEKLHALAPGQEIAYIGFPMEGLSLDGNLDINNPEAVLKQGRINKITDFNNVFSTPEFNKSIIHDIPATGGASGSPIFLPNGEIVAILWGGNVFSDHKDQRKPSAVQHNYAVRVDSIDAVKKQKIHDIREWLGEKK